MSENDAAHLQQQLADQTGLSLGLLQRPAIAGFVKRRCQELGLDDELAYHQLVIQDPSETELLVKEVSVPETWFFRYPSSFDLLTDRCSRLFRQSRNELRMLSIACATGEEPYGMTIAALQAAWPLDRIVIDAIDRHQPSLAIARRAVYRDISFRETPPPWSKRWFRTTPDGVQVDHSIVARVRFLCGDILSGSAPLGRVPYDIVFCRNLLIYLGDSARARLCRLLASWLAPEGLLFVGHAELPILAGELFEPAGVKRAFAMRRKDAVAATKNRTVASERLRPHTVRRRHRGEVPPSGKSVIRRGKESETPHPLSLADARALADAGRLEEALAVLEGIGSSGSTDADFFELLGSLKFSLGQLQEARDAFNKVLYFKHDHEQALLQMAMLSARLGNAEQAARYRRRAVRAHRAEHRQSSEKET